jgi:hypothetical protein
VDWVRRAISPDPAPDKWQADAFVSKQSPWKQNHVSISKHQTLETETHFRFQKTKHGSKTAQLIPRNRNMFPFPVGM